MKSLPTARLALWAYAAAGVALGARAAGGAAPALSVGLLGLGGYASLATAGVFWPERGMYGRTLWRGPESGRELALTFDDGPNPKTTPRVLETLAAAGVKATFFMVGRKARAHPDLVARVHAEGHQIGLHGFDHDRLFSLRGPGHVAADIERTRAVLELAGAPRPSLFRPPIGFISHLTVRGARRAGVTLVGCSARALDGLKGASSAKVTSRLIRALKPGAVLAMHDAAEHDDYVPASLSALPHVLAALHAQRLEAVTLSAWLTTVS